MCIIDTFRYLDDNGQDTGQTKEEQVSQSLVRVRMLRADLSLCFFQKDGWWWNVLSVV